MLSNESMLAVKRVFACCQMSLCLLLNEFLLACKIFFYMQKDTFISIPQLYCFLQTLYCIRGVLQLPYTIEASISLALEYRIFGIHSSVYGCVFLL